MSARLRTVTLYPFDLFTVKAGGRYSNHSALHVFFFLPEDSVFCYVIVDGVAPILNCVYSAVRNALGSPANDNLIRHIKDNAA